MKSVVIILENKENISFNDDDDTPIEEYSEKISALFQVSNITTLIFGGQSILLRPSKIFAIRVNDTIIELPLSSKLIPLKSDNNEELIVPVVEEEEDVITD